MPTHCIGPTSISPPLVRDGQGDAVTGGPLTLVIKRPDGVDTVALLADTGCRLAIAVPLVDGSDRRARAFTDPEGPSVSETTFRSRTTSPNGSNSS